MKKVPLSQKYAYSTFQDAKVHIIEPKTNSGGFYGLFFCKN